MDVLVLMLGERVLGVPLADVVEVVRAAALAPSTTDAPAVPGALNLRGEVLPVVDPQQLLEGRSGRIELSHHFVVLETPAGKRLAVHVTRAVEIVSLRMDETAEAAAHDQWGVIQLIRAADVWTRAGLEPETHPAAS